MFPNGSIINQKNKSIQNIGTNNIPQQIPYQLNNIDNNLDNNMQNDSNINDKEQKENNYGNNNKNINNNISIMSIEYENKIREDLQLNNPLISELLPINILLTDYKNNIEYSN